MFQTLDAVFLKVLFSDYFVRHWVGVGWEWVRYVRCGWVGRWWRVIGVVWVGRMWCEMGEGRDWNMGWGAGGVWLVGGWVRVI